MAVNGPTSPDLGRPSTASESAQNSTDSTTQEPKRVTSGIPLSRSDLGRRGAFMKKLRPPLVKGVADLQSQAEPTTASTTGETNQDIDTQTRQALEELQASLQSEHQVEAGEPEPQPEPLPNFGGVSQRTFDAQKARGARTTGRSGYETVQPGTDSQLAVRIAAAREARLEPLTRGKGYKTVTHQTKNPKSLFTSLAGAAKKIGQRT